MTRQTSAETYYKIEQDGLLKGLRLEVYRALFKNGPMTQMETCRAINNPSIQDRSLMPRFAELKQMGVISEVKERPCRITKRNTIEWAITENLPIKIVQKKELTKKELLLQNQALISIIRSAIFYLFQDDNKYYSNILKEKLDEVLNVNK